MVKPLTSRGYQNQTCCNKVDVNLWLRGLVLTGQIIQGGAPVMGTLVYKPQ